LAGLYFAFLVVLSKIFLAKGDLMNDLAPVDSTNKTSQEEVARQAAEYAVYQALETVYDPELGISVVELGLIRDIIFNPDQTIEIKMVLTTPFCPYAGSLVDEMRRAVEDNLDQTTKITILAEAWDPVAAGLTW
jgi:metal-sulfur cluster biosynthetic enzyme